MLVACAVFSFSVARTHAAAAPANTAVTMYKNSQQLLGQYPSETTLTTTNVNTNTFGRVASYPVDGYVYAQPLYLPNVTTASGVYNLVIVATEHDSVYAFDADHTTSTPIWQTSFRVNGATSVPSSVVYTGAYTDITPEIGITGTPVVDPTTGTLYVSAMSYENGTVVHRLHALDITTGNDKTTPVVETATVPGTGDGSVNGSITFAPNKENQRPALVLLNGVVYVAFASYADSYPYHGWILGYDATSLAQTAVFNTSPDGGAGGLWGAGAALSVDPTDNSLFVPVGNGTFNLNTGGSSAGETLMKLSTANGLHLTDYFTPFNETCLNSVDRDLGSGGALILPTQTGAAHPNVLVNAGKEGRIYVVDRTALGKFTTVADPCNNQSATSYDNVVQELAPGTLGTGGVYSTAAYWSGTVYMSSNGGPMKAFPLNNGVLDTTAPTQTPEKFNFPGPNPVISSNGNTPGTGIVWIISPPASCPTLDHCNPSGGGALRAYDAANLGTELYSSTQNTARDGLASYVKFTVPTVANGQVFVGTQSSLDIFGLNPPAVTPTPTPSGTPSPTPSPTPTPPPPAVAYNNVGTSDDTAPGTGNFDGTNSYSAEALASVGIVPGAAIPVNDAQFTWPNPSAGTNNNYRAAGQVLPVTPVSGAQTLAFLGAATNGTQSGTATITYTDGSTQTFALAFSDWTLNGGISAPISNNIVAVKSPYRNTPNGKNTVQTDVFYSDVALLAGKTVKSVTLPSLWGMHVFAVATTALPPAVVTSSAPPYNNTGTSDDAAPTTGNFDGVNSYSGQALQAAGVTPGATVTINGAQFVWPNAPVGSKNNYRAAGQVLPVTSVAGAQTLALLGAANNGVQSGTATITYTDGTTQTFTLAFSDWTLGAGTQVMLATNQAAAVSAYRNTPQGKQTEKVYVFYTDVTLQPGKTALSVTLPTVSGLHVFAVATTANASTTYSLPPYNNVGTSDDTAPTSGSFDGTASYSAQALQAAGVTPGATLAINGTQFTWPSAPSGANNNYQASGQVLPLAPAAGATSLAFLGAAVGGTQSGTATITYTDGTTQTFTLTFSDWTLNGGTSSPIPGNSIAITTAYRNTPSGKQSVQTDVFYTEVALQAGKTVQSVTLPSLWGLHVFALATKAPYPYNNIGTSDDSAPAAGNFDGKNSYSAQALQAAGITPGVSLTVNGATFQWPVAASGVQNNYRAAGQKLLVTPSAGASTLAFLGAATGGTQSGTATITYTDGTTQTFTLAFSDWTLGGGAGTPIAGNSIAITTPYRNTPTGKQTEKTYVFYTEVALLAGKTVQSVTLPSVWGLHVFALTTK